MNTKLLSYCATILVATAIATTAADPAKAQPKKGSAEFEKMKSLIGTWKGKTDMGQGPVDVTVTYKLLAGGSVLEEKIFEGTPHEMVSMYYDQTGKLAMTHYCMFGNRPGMLLKSSDDKTIMLDFDKTCGIDAEKESHMHALTITFEDANTITSSCKPIIDGKEVPDHAVTLKRVRA
jgi:hypothetical protein